jgi:hypothetical protein
VSNEAGTVTVVRALSNSGSRRAGLLRQALCIMTPRARITIDIANESRRPVVDTSRWSLGTPYFLSFYASSRITSLILRETR